MERIASFAINHDTLEKGMYISRTDCGDIVTYDIRMKLPNAGDYLSTGCAHTIEHLFATYARNSAHTNSVVYVGPMGCRTGFYLVTKGLDTQDAIRLVQDSMEFISRFEGDIPGATKIECGNYLDQDLPSAKEICAEMAEVLKNWAPDNLAYKE